MDILKLVVVVSMFVAAGSATGASIRYEGGQVVGVDGVSIEGEMWNADFLSGSFQSSGATTYSKRFAIFASRSLRDLLNDEFVGTQFDLTPDIMQGCIYETCYLVTTYMSNESSGRNEGKFAVNYGGSHLNYSGTSYYPYSYDSGRYSHLVWTEAVTVPEPNVVWLIGSGLLGMYGVSGKKKRSKITA